MFLTFISDIYFNYYICMVWLWVHLLQQLYKLNKNIEFTGVFQ